MTHIITSLCVREGSCVTVCPVECIVPGEPQGEWPWFYIDPDTCIDCGACIPECPFHAIFTEDDVPSAYLASGGEVQVMPEGTLGFDEPFDGYDYEGNPVHITSTRRLKPGEVVDLTPDIEANYDYFSKGTGYDALLK
ncbi:MAG: indolepyruvate ferredoxin oxidoreductase subunit alpha [Brevefilum sp.]|jgi:ferredoxin